MIVRLNLSLTISIRDFVSSARSTESTNIMEDNEPETGLTVYDMTDRDWAEVRQLAIQMKDAGRLEGDNFKCGILGFIEWLCKREKNIIAATEIKEETSTLH